MANLIRTQQTYGTVQNAEKKLAKALEREGLTLQDVRYLIAAATGDNAGRFVPVLVGAQYIPYIHRGVTVVG